MPTPANSATEGGYSLSQASFERLAAIVTDMRICTLHDNLTAYNPHLPADVRTLMYANALCVQNWGNIIEFVLNEVSDHAKV